MRSSQSRALFSFTFVSAGPGDAVSFNVPVYASASAVVQEKRLTLDGSSGVSVWAAPVAVTAIARTVSGQLVAVEATVDRPTVAEVPSGGGGSGLPVPGSGDAGKVVTVTGGEDGFELDAPAGGASVPSPTTGDAGKVVTVNGDEDGYELDTPSAGYVSLTGAGEGASPGDLTQNGALTVSGAFEADIPDDGTAFISAVGEGTVQLATQDGTLNIASTATGTVQITTQDGDLDLRTFGAGEISLQAEAENSSIAIVANQPGSAVWITGAAISFFGVAPTARPDAPTTLEEVIAALQALGLVGT